MPVAAVKMAKKFMYFDSGKAIRELGLPQTSVRQALKDAVAWFQEQGYV
jgi:dihydroflavonol-4-reductase